MSIKFTVRGSAYPKALLSGALLGLAFMWSCAVQAQSGAPKVEYLQLQETKVRQWSGFSARISPVESVDIRPLVGGQLVKVLFREGEHVEQGQPLFVIDPRPFEAAVKQAEATLATAKAQARLASQELARSQHLKASNLISQSVLDEALTSDDIASAIVLRAQSALLQAQLNLEYAHIVAPISGRVGRAELTAGNIVGVGASAPVLTTIVSHEQVYAEFNVDEQTFLALSGTSNTPAKMPVQLLLAGSPATMIEGHVHAFDNHLDAASGTIRTRAIFNNTEQRLVPGMFAAVRLGASQVQNTILIPERAIGTNQDRKFVYVIDDTNTAQYREVTVGQQYKGLRAVNTGLQPGERIVVRGIARIRPNTPVEPSAQTESENVASVKF